MCRSKSWAAVSLADLLRPFLTGTLGVGGRPLDLITTVLLVFLGVGGRLFLV
jgi:hypothetical protein